LDDIAKQAGVGPGTLYRHFPTREETGGYPHHRLAASQIDLSAKIQKPDEIVERLLEELERRDSE
jgi:AcrR family transcriptional regulator